LEVKTLSDLDLIVDALAGGAAAGLTDSAGSAVRDAYQGLRDMVRRWIAAHHASGSEAVALLEQGEGTESEQKSRLGEALSSLGAAPDPEIVAAAQALLAMISEPRGGTSTVVIGDGVMVGNHNNQINKFS
jgi:hypothetical protein